MNTRNRHILTSTTQYTAVTILLSMLFATTVYAAPPVATTDVRTVPTNVPITIDVLNNDFDPDGDGLSVPANRIIQPNNGTVVVNSDGGVQYTPDPDYVGADSFIYVVVDDSPDQEEANGTVTINVVPTTITAPEFAPNQRSVAQALDSICNDLAGTDPSGLPDGRQQLIAQCEALLALELTDEEAAREAVQQITPEETLSLTTIGDNASALQVKMVGNRLMQLSQSTSAAARGGLTWSTNLAGDSAGEYSILSRIGVFASIQLEDAEKKHSNYESGFDYGANSITAGADYAISPNWFAGGALGWISNDLDYKDKGGSVDADIYTFIGYSTYHLENFSFDLQVGIGNSNIDISRTISYATLDGQFDAVTDGQTSGSQWFVSIQSQYMWSYDAFTLFPMAKFNVSNSQVSRYADKDAGGWEVVLGEQNIRQQNIEAGVQGTYAWQQRWGVLIPNFDLSLIADLDTDQDIMSGGFAYAPIGSQTFNMYGQPPESMYYMLGLGFSAILPNGTTGFMNIRETLGYSDYSSTQLQAGFRMEF